MTNDDASDTRRVLPSGADFATYSAPMIWFAPGLFSTMTGWPRSSERRAPIWRERGSGGPPGGGGKTIFTGRGGECWGTGEHTSEIPALAFLLCRLLLLKKKKKV